jgi:putative SOS response-associated peptidase YedK
MCNRYSLTTPVEPLQRVFGFANLPNLEPRYNIAPSQRVAIVRLTADARELILARWGLIPSWGKLRPKRLLLTNARSEEVRQKPAFRDAFARRRCLVPADGFYEWRKREGSGESEPWRIVPADGGPFAFAGLWEPREAEGEGGPSFAILTTAANAKIRTVHDRMPAILPPRDFAVWLSPRTPADQLVAILKPCPDARLSLYRVSSRVNNVRNDDAACIAPLA